MKIIQINLNRAKAAHDILEDRVRRDDIDICIINEANPKISERKKNKDEGWITDEVADTTIWIVNKEIRIKRRKERKGSTLVETNEGLCVISCYFSPNRTIQEYEEYIENLEELIDTPGGDHLIVAGDFNASSHNWEAPRTNARGLCLEEMAARQGLFLLNKGKKPTFSRNGPNGTRQEAFLDIAFSTKPAEIQSWKVRDEIESMSDHLYIDMEIKSTDTGSQEDTRTRWNINKMDKEVLRNTIDEKCRKLKEEDRKPDEQAIMEILNKACEEAQPKTSPHLRRRIPVYWWSTEVSTLRKECIKARRKYTRSKTRSTYSTYAERHILEYTEARNRYKWGIIEAKRNKWKELCEEVRNNIWGLPYKIIRDKLGGKTLRLTEEKTEETIRKLFPQRDITERETIEYDHKDIPEVTKYEMEIAAERMATGKAPGPDGIPPEAIKILAKRWPELIGKMIDDMLRRGEFPDRWKNAKLVLIPKGKRDTYRPICLLDTTAKITETVINWRLQEELKEKEGLSPNQYRFSSRSIHTHRTRRSL